MSDENKEPKKGRRWRRYPWRFERWPAWWLIGLQAAALCEWVAGIAAPLSQRLVGAYRWNREIFHWAYGVPWRWITDRLWRTPMFDQRPWHCLVCGGEWLPQGGDLSVFVRYGHFEGNIFRPYDENEPLGPHGEPRVWKGWWTKVYPLAWAWFQLRTRGLAGEVGRVRGWWTPDFGGLWWPRPGHASDCVCYVHKWHFVKVDDTAPVLRGKRGRDALTGELYRRRPVHPWHEQAEYGLRWTWAHVRAIAIFALLRFSIAWVQVWKWTPWRGHRRPASIFDGLCRRVVTNAPPWGWTPWRYVDRSWPDGSLVWRIRAWRIRTWNRLLGLRYRAASFWQRRHAIWAAMPWPWHPVDGDPDGERRRIGEHLYYCWRVTGWRTPDEPYFIAGGIDLPPYFVIETDEGPRPKYPGLGMVIGAGNVDGVIPSDDGIQAGQEPSWDDRLVDGTEGVDPIGMVEEGGLPVEIRLVSERQDGKTLTIILGGVEIEVERLEGGALRVKRPGEDGA